MVRGAPARPVKSQRGEKSARRIVNSLLPDLANSA